MRKYYKVAGHSFSIEADGCFCWDVMDNYAPFETICEAGELLFSITVVDSLPDGTCDAFYRDNPKEDDMTCIDIFRQCGGFLLEMRPCRNSREIYRLWTTPDFREGRLLKWDIAVTGRFPLDNAAMVLYAMASAGKNTLTMHASVTVRDSTGYLFLGKSGTGKSTHSRLWMENIPGCRLLNDDNPVVRVGEDGIVRVYGTPWSGKTPCYRNECAVAGAFVELSQFPENRIRRMSVIESLAAFYMSCSGLRRLDYIADGLDNTISAVLESVPCWHLDCLPDAAAARLCCETIGKR